MPDINKLSRYVLEELQANRIDKSTAISLVKKLNEREDIAIIGMGCKIADTEDYNTYWEMIKNRKMTIERCSKRRIDLIRSYFPKFLSADESMYSKGTYFDDMEMFDYRFFLMTEQEAVAMNPGHRMIIQTVYRTLEDAGYLGEKNDGNRTGVFIGNNYSKDLLFSYSRMELDNSKFNYSFEHMLNNWTSGLATRIARIFDMKGGAYTIDASCPSASVAIYNACQALKNGQCTTAIAGGLLADLAPLKSFTNIGWVFTHGDSAITRSYDNNSDGGYIGEAAGAVYLKPLTQAVLDGDRIHGIICGYAFNNNGAGGTYTQSSVEDIKKVVIRAVKSSQVSVEEIDFLEGEGYPGKVEEGLELSGLIAGFNHFTDKRQFCGIGSISPNFGYLQSAIGAMCLIKLVMAMKEKEIPPQCHFIEPTDMVNIVKSPFYVSNAAKPWGKDDNKPRYCAMFSYGYGGNNLMIIAGEAPKRRHGRELDRNELFVLTAVSEKSFYNYIKEYIDLLEDEQKIIIFTDMCYTASVRRRMYSEYRLAILAHDGHELLSKLKSFYENNDLMAGAYVGGEFESRQGMNRKIVRNSVKGKALDEIAAGFCEGKNYLFSELYEGENVYMEDLPQYPFDKARCWAGRKQMTIKELLAGRKMMEMGIGNGKG